MKSHCKHVLLSCIFLLAFIALPQTSAQAQDARSLLNNTASKLRQAGGISATFNAAVFKNRKWSLPPVAPLTSAATWSE